MKSVIGVIFGNTSANLLEGLAQDRPIAAVPFGGKYRLLDFALSSMVNSGIKTVGLITPQHYRPLVDHLGAGKDWFLDRKSGGLFILPGSMHGLMGERAKFSIRDIAQNVEFLRKDSSENVIISYCNQVFNINYQDALHFHEKRTADITMIYKQSMQASDLEGRLMLGIGEEQEVYKLREHQRTEKIESPRAYFVDMLIIRRKLFLEIVEKYKAMDEMDLLDIIMDNLRVLKVYAYLTQAYITWVDSLKDYFKCSMDLFNPEVNRELLTGKNKIHSKTRDNPPTQYCKGANVTNSLVAGGCIIEGTVENSILSRDVRVKAGAVIKNSIILQKCLLNENTVLENVILDKFVEIKKGNVIKGSSENPLVLAKHAII